MPDVGWYHHSNGCSSSADGHSSSKDSIPPPVFGAQNVSNQVEARNDEEEDENSDNSSHSNDMLPFLVSRAPDVNDQAEAHNNEDEDDNSSHFKNPPHEPYETNEDTNAPVPLFLEHDPNELVAEQDAALASIDEEVEEGEEEGGIMLQLLSWTISLHLENLLGLEIMEPASSSLHHCCKPTLINGKF